MAANRTPMHTYKVIWECTTRANFELQGELVVRASCMARAIARVRERIGYRYAIPDAAVEVPYCAEVIPRIHC
jgi:hypothetical protein